MFLAASKYTAQEVEKITGLKRHHLAYYKKIDVFPPTGTEEENGKENGAQRNGSNGKRRKYSVLDVLVLQAVAELKVKGMPFLRIRRVIDYLKKNHNLQNPFHAALDGRHNVSILTDGRKNFYICFNDHDVVEHLKGGGQYMLLDVSDVAYDLREKLKALQIYRRKLEDRKFKKAANA